MRIKENIVVDNSVVMKIVMKEKGFEKALKIIESAHAIKTSLFVPQLFVFEFYNIANRLVGPDEADAVFDYLQKAQFSVVQLDEYGRMQASTIMNGCNNKVSYYDAAYHALAFQMDAIFVTADEKYFEIAERIGRIKLL